jgi:protein-disulfide isomerase
MAGKKNNNNKRTPVRPASTRPTGFYYVLGAVALIGASILGYSMTRKQSAAVGTDAVANAGPVGTAQGYLIGKPDAPVKIEEFADFECPGCGQFATVTEPDVQKRIIDAGLANLTYYDFPLPQHKNSQAASNAAACAADQGKFWEMHDAIFGAQDEWNTEATDNPKPFFQRYAERLGINPVVWEACYDARKHQGRIMANAAEGERRKVNSTPTFFIGGKKYEGALPYDALKAIVDSATKK